MWRDYQKIHPLNLKQALDTDMGHMDDSEGRPVSGLLAGNLNMAGDREECLEISYLQFCDIFITSKTLQREIKIGVCTPNVCTREEVRNEGLLDINLWFNRTKTTEFTMTDEQLSRISCESRAGDYCIRSMQELVPGFPSENSTQKMNWFHNRILDAWGKPGAGMAKGNLRWEGSKSECLAVRGTMHCLVPMRVTFGSNDVREGLYGVCVPRTCNGEAVLRVLHAIIDTMIDEFTLNLMRFGGYPGREMICSHGN